MPEEKNLTFDEVIIEALPFASAAQIESSWIHPSDQVEFRYLAQPLTTTIQLKGLLNRQST